MTARIHFNNFKTALSGSLSNVATTVTFAASIPSLSGNIARFTIYGGGNYEIIEINSNSGAPTYSGVTRGLEGTTALNWPDGSRVECRDTANSYDRKQENLSGLTITSASPTTADRFLFQDDSDSNNLKYVLGSNLMTLGPLGLINAQTVSGQSDIHVTGLADYSKIEFVLCDIVPGTDNSELRMRTSTDNGSSYDSAAANYRYCGRLNVDTPTGNQEGVAAGSTFITLTPGSVGNSTGEQAAGTVTLFNPAGTSYRLLTLDIVYFNVSTTLQGFNAVASRTTSADIDAVQFYFSAGTINGSLYTYGYKKL